MELVKKKIHMDRVASKAGTQMVLEEDVNISDNRPDASHLIAVKGDVVMDEIRVSDDRVSLKGRLQAQMLYLTEEEGMCASMQAEFPLEEKINMEGVHNGDTVLPSWIIEDLTVGLINSRKISVQAMISFELELEEKAEQEAAVDIYHEEPVEYRKQVHPLLQMAVNKKDIFRIKEEVEIPGSFPNIASVIWSEVVPGTVEFKALEDKIALQGELHAFFLYRGQNERGQGDEEEICHYETTLPFAGSLECGGCREGMIPEIHLCAQNKDVEVRPDFDGEERVITFEQCLELDICIYEEDSIDILSDVYGVVKEVAVQEKNADFKRLQGKCSGKAKISGHFKAQEENAMLHKILHTAGKLQIGEKKAVEGGIEITGTVELQIFYECSNEKERYGVIRGSIPFQYLLETDGSLDDCVYPVNACVDQIAVAIIDNQEVDVKCVLYFRANIYRKWQEKIVEQIIVTEPDMEKMAALPGIAVYMVREGESLWDIGKRYYVPVSVIKQTNALQNDEVRAGDKILIVKGM